MGWKDGWERQMDGEGGGIRRTDGKGRRMGKTDGEDGRMDVDRGWIDEWMDG